MIVEEMQKTDVDEVATMEKEIFSDGWSRETIANTQMLEHTYVVVAREGQVVGYLILYLGEDTADIARVAVLPKVRRGGVAKAMLEHMEKYCNAQKIERILLEVRANNQSAINLYNQQGFSSIGKRKAYYTNPVEDGIVMEKQLVISTSHSTKKQI